LNPKLHNSLFAPLIALGTIFEIGHEIERIVNSVIFEIHSFVPTARQEAVNGRAKPHRYLEACDGCTLFITPLGKGLGHNRYCGDYGGAIDAYRAL
jgi:hypothetical protein